jgi:Fe-S-cluster containining protein
MSDAPAPAREPACLRTGQCCRTIPIHLSPRQLREAYRGWRDGTLPPQKPPIEDIHLLFPMLGDRCLGKKVAVLEDGSRSFIYLYGPCRNLIEGPVPACGIHEDKPAMCRRYPYYDGTRSANPGYMRGCGFNLDPQAGLTADEHRSALEPLTADER